MEGPLFQNFTKEVIQNPLISDRQVKYDMTAIVNKEDMNVQELFMMRNRENLGKHVYTLMCDDDFCKKKQIDILMYIKNLTRCDAKHFQLDLNEKYDASKLKKDVMYIFDLRSQDVRGREIFGEAVLNIILRDMLEKCSGFIFIADKLDKVPNLIKTMSQLVFVDKEAFSMKEMEEILMKMGLLSYKSDVKIDIDFLVINKSSLVTKIANFSKFTK